MHLSDDDRAYLGHLLAALQASREQANLDAFLGYLTAKHGLPAGAKVTPDGAILLPTPPEPPPAP